MNNRITPTNQSVPNLLTLGTEKCLSSVTILHSSQPVACCLPCFYNSDLIGKTSVFRVLNTHLLTNGPYNPWCCVFCKNFTIKVRRASECSCCLNNYSKVEERLEKKGLDINSTYYLFDNVEEELLHTAPFLLTHNKEE